MPLFTLLIFFTSSLLALVTAKPASPAAKQKPATTVIVSESYLSLYPPAPISLCPGLEQLIAPFRPGKWDMDPSFHVFRTTDRGKAGFKHQSKYEAVHFEVTPDFPKDAPEIVCIIRGGGSGIHSEQILFYQRQNNTPGGWSQIADFQLAKPCMPWPFGNAYVRSVTLSPGCINIAVGDHTKEQKNDYGSIVYRFRLKDGVYQTSAVLINGKQTMSKTSGGPASYAIRPIAEQNMPCIPGADDALCRLISSLTPEEKTNSPYFRVYSTAFRGGGSVLPLNSSRLFADFNKRDFPKNGPEIVCVISDNLTSSHDIYEEQFFLFQRDEKNPGEWLQLARCNLTDNMMPWLSHDDASVNKITMIGNGVDIAVGSRNNQNKDYGRISYRFQLEDGRYKTRSILIRERKNKWYEQMSPIQ